MNIHHLAEQIKHNCNISDAKYWGFFSICGLLLRMRELYRAEKGLAFYDPIAMENISAWIEERDRLWQSLQEEPFNDIRIDRWSYSPFSVDDINGAIRNEGIVYGAGYGRYMKPNFFLARMEETREVRDFQVYIMGRELARDIDTPPAMLQGRCIFIRKHLIKGLIWDRFHELKAKKYTGVLDYAFKAFGISRKDSPSKRLDKEIEGVVQEMTEMIIAHEIGEAMEDEESSSWLEILRAFNSTKEELTLRAVKDVMADCSPYGSLNYIRSQERKGLLGFYMVFFTGMKRIIVPEMFNAFDSFVENGDWEIIDNARQAGYARSLSIRDKALSLWKETGGKEKTENYLKELM